MFMGSMATASALELPDVLGNPPASTSAEWIATQRPATLELFRKHVYGRPSVERPEKLSFETVEEAAGALGGTATLRIVNVRFSGEGGEGIMKLILFIPEKAKKPAPGFLLICNRPEENIDPTRKTRSPFWPAEEIVARGYVAATFLNSNLDPDHDDGFKDGVHGIFDPKGAERPGDAWGTIAAWGWGASRAMDYFETAADIDEKRIAVIGHSRGGKTALWAGASDERFGMAISNDSGCTGAALARRKHGERVKKINDTFPHWFCKNYRAFNEREDDLPIDQHQLIALMAPRPVYVASATGDDWADPLGEFLAARNAGPVYALFGLKGLGADEMPPADHPLATGHIGYHLRTGKHDLSLYDWQRYMDFADLHFKPGK